MLARHATKRVLAGLADSPVVFVQGARQVGKSTLVRAIAERDHPGLACHLHGVDAAA